jgi:hypothetical protein
VRYLAVVTLIAVALLGGCARPGATGVSVDSAFRRLIPPDTKALAAVNLDGLKTSPFYERHRSELNFPLLDGMSERVGLDPRRDISSLLIAWNGKDAIAMARGGFNLGALQSKLPALGARPMRYKSYRLFGEGHDALTFLKHGVALGGPVEALRSEIDLESNGGGAVPAEFEARLAAIPKADQIWAASRGGLAFAEAPMRSDIESALSNIVGYIDSTTLGLGFDTGMHLTGEIICVSNEGAQRVHDALRGGIGLARLATRDNESDLLKVYDAIQVTQDQHTVRVKADLSADLTDKLIAHLPSIQNRADQVLRER